MMFRPFMGDPNYVPWGDPPVIWTFGDDQNQLVAEDWGDRFEIKGNLKIIALHILKYVLSMKSIGVVGVTLSAFQFIMEDKIEIKPSKKDIPPEAYLIIEEMNKILKLKVFL